MTEPKKCPKCGAEAGEFMWRLFPCGTRLYMDSDRIFYESPECLRRQLAQRTARAEKAEAEVERLRGLVVEIIGTVCRGRLASIGSLGNTYVPQIDVATVEQWKAAEAAKEKP